MEFVKLIDYQMYVEKYPLKQCYLCLKDKYASYLPYEVSTHKLDELKAKLNHTVFISILNRYMLELTEKQDYQTLSELEQYYNTPCPIYILDQSSEGYKYMMERCKDFSQVLDYLVVDAIRRLDNYGVEELIKHPAYKRDIKTGLCDPEPHARSLGYSFYERFVDLEQAWAYFDSLIHLN